MISRLAGNDQRAREVIKHLTATFEHVGRMLHALQHDNWSSARDHLSRVSERAAIADVYLNVGHPDAGQTLAAVREQLPKDWADAIAAFLAGGVTSHPAIVAVSPGQMEIDTSPLPAQGLEAVPDVA